jgi:hypothetical protein
MPYRLRSCGLHVQETSTLKCAYNFHNFCVQACMQTCDVDYDTMTCPRCKVKGKDVGRLQDAEPLQVDIDPPQCGEDDIGDGEGDESLGDGDECGGRAASQPSDDDDDDMRLNDITVVRATPAGPPAAAKAKAEGKAKAKSTTAPPAGPPAEANAKGKGKGKAKAKSTTAPPAGPPTAVKAKAKGKAKAMSTTVPSAGPPAAAKAKGKARDAAVGQASRDAADEAARDAADAVLAVTPTTLPGSLAGCSDGSKLVNNIDHNCVCDTCGRLCDFAKLRVLSKKAGRWQCCSCGSKAASLRRKFGQWSLESFQDMSKDRKVVYHMRAFARDHCDMCCYKRAFARDHCELKWRQAHSEGWFPQWIGNSLCGHEKARRLERPLQDGLGYPPRASWSSAVFGMNGLTRARGG